MRTTELTIETGSRRGLFDITAQCQRFVADTTASASADLRDGLLNVFVPHATAGLVIIELGAGSDLDLLVALERLLPRDSRWIHEHGTPGHGADHVVPFLAPPSITVPVVGGRLALGTWQSIALLDTNADNPRRTLRLSFVAG